MSRRPVYRWKSFWLGLCVLVFLGWAWLRSMEWMSGVSWQWTVGDKSEWVGQSIAVEQDEGRVSLWWDSYNPLEMDGMRRWNNRIPLIELNVTRNPFEPVDTVAEDEEIERIREEGSGLFPEALVMGHAWISVAHWVLWLGFLLTWGGWMVWRWRREKQVSLTEVEIGMDAEVSR